MKNVLHVQEENENIVMIYFDWHIYSAKRIINN